ncbi:MAG: response regulator [Moorea sp. SIO1F2]|uniref:Two-component system response regulator n=2 Tax=Moorena TaxID=1155738 RepID=A0A1D8TLK7_9CYAN|nr:MULTISPECIES: response regulator [Moorena]NEN95620.1 response regulator [Moorena sp. SIO3I7]NEO63645.1 response regulator [Moorena sp. SIO4G2]NEQ81239.1 response regulator [Moorena sp. SIO2I5]AOW98499.1 two-component system response regulator [Moorena producens PAL-8-15-08-1]NEO08280.1 response regulator [Moorena sp. SIO3I8]
MSKVLIVEDNLAQLELMARYLRDSGNTVICIADAKDALDKAVTEKPDVIVLDIVMPGMSGFELCRSLKNHRDTTSIPIVICSSKNQDIDRLWGMKQGADAYLTKPFSKQQLVDIVKLAVV